MTEDGFVAWAALESGFLPLATAERWADGQVAELGARRGGSRTASARGRTRAGEWRGQG